MNKSRKSSTRSQRNNIWLNPSMKMMFHIDAYDTYEQPTYICVAQSHFQIQTMHCCYIFFDVKLYLFTTESDLYSFQLLQWTAST
ncbi:uncharacterized protein PHALS_15383 [Plasmopara halstedii]|uniref:Uncharacterized protein n=1 Tax=Plasmopara halstedii TaxID=4781 RepID=A0A0P1AG18_PLAHL|nr:uncharacterized protein PHALS_15383 [Plasmopara halstedii]CEG39400.1 hypothetical protein PHALS_15383 [Plasmopara halstedii]|eukprot:XP_024575769.1 hypothetical protein PHALS_15383 [Plasmopara halstedii]